MNWTNLHPCKFWAAIGSSLLSFAAWAQTIDAPPPLAVGDKWTYRFHNIGDKREPHLSTNEVKTVDATSAWIYGETQDPNSPDPKYMVRYDIKRAASLERFAFDPAAPNAAGQRRFNRQANGDRLQFPLVLGKSYTIKEFWDNGDGYTEYKADIQAFEKVKVGAGDFDAYRIKYSGWWTRTSNGSGRGSAAGTIWYAPSVKNAVKSEYMDRTGGNQIWNQSTTELMRWEPSTVTTGQATATPGSAASAAK